MTAKTVPELRALVDSIEGHLKQAMQASQELQQIVHDTEEDSDLFRKLSFYLTPNMHHWINGAQAGSMKDLKDLLAKREK